MTISKVIRKRLRRYALYCLMAATSSGLVSMAPHAIAENTHDGSPLCGLITQLSESATEISGQPSDTESLDESVQPSAPQFLSIKVDGELTIDTCNYSEWLATHVPTPKSNDRSPSKVDVVIPSRTSGQFNRALATLAAAASAGSPIPLTHLTEPFAMIGPDGSHTPKEIEAFQNWYEESKSLVAKLKLDAMKSIVSAEFVPVVDFSGELTESELQSPCDRQLDSQLAAAPVSVALELPVALQWPDPLNQLVGSSAVIFTIKEAYLPYDLTASDRELLSQVTPSESQLTVDTISTNDSPAVQQFDSTPWASAAYVSSLQPFCIRSLESFREPGWGPLARSEFPLAPRDATAGSVDRSQTLPDSVVVASDPPVVDDKVVISQPIADVNEAVAVVDGLSDLTVEVATSVSRDGWAIGVCGSPDCWLDEWVWQVGVTLDQVQLPDEWFRSERIGREFASLVVSGDRIASHLARELALVWPAAALPVNPIPGSGAKLLARAEAAEQLPEQGSVDSLTPQQLAQASAMVRQWVEVAQSVLDDFSVRMNHVTEVARNRGTQNDANRR